MTRDTLRIMTRKRFRDGKGVNKPGLPAKPRVNQTENARKETLYAIS